MSQSRVKKSAGSRLIYTGDFTGRNNNSTTTTSGDCVCESSGNFGSSSGGGSSSGRGFGSSSTTATCSSVLCYELQFCTKTFHAIITLPLKKHALFEKTNHKYYRKTPFCQGKRSK